MLFNCLSDAVNHWIYLKVGDWGEWLMRLAVAGLRDHRFHNFLHKSRVKMQLLWHPVLPEPFDGALHGAAKVTDFLLWRIAMKKCSSI